MFCRQVIPRSKNSHLNFNEKTFWARYRSRKSQFTCEKKKVNKNHHKDQWLFHSLQMAKYSQQIPFQSNVSKTGSKLIKFPITEMFSEILL